MRGYHAPNAQLIENFYSSFQKKDAARMIACYHPDVEFADAIFSLKGKKKAGAHGVRTPRPAFGLDAAGAES